MKYSDRRFLCFVLLVLAALLFSAAETVPSPPRHAELAKAAHSSSRVDHFAAAFAEATLLRQEPDLEFVAGIGEPTFPAYTLRKPDERLVRRTGLFQMPNGTDLQRLDRVYRLKIGHDEANRQATPQDTPDAVRALDAGGGELVWSNAMAANRIQVRMRPGFAPEDLLRRLPKYPAKVSEIAEQLYLLTSVSADPPRLEDWLAECLACGGLIEYAQPDFCLTGCAAVNDCGFAASKYDTAKQWYLHQVNAPAGWLTGKDTLIPNTTTYKAIAVLDTGITSTHPDLMPNLLPGKSFVDTNPDQAEDDDGHGTQVAGIIGAKGNNLFGITGIAQATKLLPVRIMKRSAKTGFIGNSSDAVRGMNWVRGSTATYNTVVSNHSWGMTVWDRSVYESMIYATPFPLGSIPGGLPAGLTGAFTVASNMVSLTADVNHNLHNETAKIKPGMKLGAGISTDPMVLWVDYNKHQLYMVIPFAGAHNTSLPISIVLYTVSQNYGVLNVVAAGNDGKDLDLYPVFPACFPSTIVVTVGASSDLDKRLTGPSINTNYGNHTVHIYAPGLWMLTTNNVPYYNCCQPLTPPSNLQDSGYKSVGGTSFAAPLVSGAAAIYLAKNPSATVTSVRNTLIGSGVKVGDLCPLPAPDCVSTGGRLDLDIFLKK